MIKKSIIPIFLTNILISLVSAQTIKIDFPQGDEFGAGEKISLKVSLLDSENKPINQNVDLIFEDSLKNQITKTVETNKVEEIDLGENVMKGIWKVTAKYEDIEEVIAFTIREKEEVIFEIAGDVLTITNAGNTFYSKKIDILIGDTIGSKEINLEVGESTNFRLIAPDETYNIKISDGTTTLTRGKVSLTGEAIGILDNRLNQRTPITGINPENPEDYSFVKQNPLAYLFVLAVVGAAILLTIERRYRKRRI